MALQALHALCTFQCVQRTPRSLQARSVKINAKKQKPQTKRQRKAKLPLDRRIYIDVDADEAEDGVEEAWGVDSRIPAAPSPKTSAKRADELQPEDVYPVFKRELAVTRLGEGTGDGKWSWGEESSSTDEPLVPKWNPKTGFMRSREELEAEEQAAAARRASSSAASSSTASNSTAGNTTADARYTAGETSTTSPTAAAAAAASISTGLTTAAADPDVQLPPVTKGQVLSACVSTSFWMTVVALLIRAYAERSASAVLGTDAGLLRELLRLPAGGLEDGDNALIMLGVVGLVTGARVLLTQRWREFEIATYRSNKQVLTPLNWADVALVASLTGFSEELLFRGALIPGSFPDWRGVLLAGVLFGALHNSGGRNVAFAAWAAAVGCLYGAVFLYTGNIWVPAGAHALSNFCSAALWISAFRQPDGPRRPTAD